jgi:hypothetical protein
MTVKPDDIPDIESGDLIRASWLNDVKNMAQSAFGVDHESSISIGGVTYKRPRRFRGPTLFRLTEALAAAADGLTGPAFAEANLVVPDPENAPNSEGHPGDMEEVTGERTYFVVNRSNKMYGANNDFVIAQFMNGEWLILQVL